MEAGKKSGLNLDEYSFKSGHCPLGIAINVRDEHMLQVLIENGAGFQSLLYGNAAVILCHLAIMDWDWFKKVTVTLIRAGLLFDCHPWFIFAILFSILAARPR